MKENSNSEHWVASDGLPGQSKPECQLTSGIIKVPSNIELLAIVSNILNV